MANTIILKKSSTASSIPAAGSLQPGELAVNLADAKLYTKTVGGTVILVGSGAAGGTVTSVAASGGTTGLTFTGSPITTSGTLTLGGTLGVANGGTGATTAAAARVNLSAAVLGANGDITSLTGITGGISSPDFVQFDTTAVVTPAAGRLYFNDGEGGLSYTLKGGNVVQEVGQSQQVRVYNSTGATLNKGQVVYSNGAQGQRPTVALALATSDATSARTLGIVAESIANGAEGWVTSLGIIENIDTSAFTAGAQLYLSGATAGGLTATKTVAPIHMVYVARCIKSHATSGRLFVTVQNGYELDELHDVSAVSPANNDGIFYNTATSLWEKKSIVTALGYTPYNATNPSGYITSSGSITGNAGTATALQNARTINGVSFNGTANITVADATKLPLAGGTMTGAIAFAAGQTWPTFNQSTTGNAANVTGTVAAANGGTGLTSPGASGNVLTSNGTTWVSQSPAANIAIGETPPSSPTAGTVWWDSDTGIPYIYYNDGTSSQWVTFAMGPSGSNGTNGTDGVAVYPQNIQSANYTLALSDAGKHIYSSNTAAQTITIPTNASVAFPIGSVVTIVNMGTTKIGLSISGVSIIPTGSITALSSAQIPSGTSVQLMKTATNTWNAIFGTVALNAATASYLIVGGGGSGGSNDTNMGTGGGGAGGLLSGTSPLAVGTTYTITVGAGGATQSGNGNGNSGFASSALSVTASGGGGGSGVALGSGVAGASGGGGSGSFNAGTTAGGAGTSGQGFAGGTGQNSTSDANVQCGGGGGGASAVGVNAGLAGGNGGAGTASSITGSSVTYAGGGGGGKRTAGTAGTGGVGGGGNGGADANGSAGTANRGGGGGGAGTGGGGVIRTGGAGGSGVVILSIPTGDYSGITTGSPTVTTSGSNTILQFNSSGSYTA